MGGHCAIIEFKVIAEHREQMLFKPHDEWVHPRIKNDVTALKPICGEYRAG